MCNEHIFRNGSFLGLRIAKESNDLADLAKVVPESYQKSNEFSVNRKNRQNVATDDRRTFTGKDKVCHIQTIGNDNKDAMLDCESGFHQSTAVASNRPTEALASVISFTFVVYSHYNHS